MLLLESLGASATDMGVQCQGSIRAVDAGMRPVRPEFPLRNGDSTLGASERGTEVACTECTHTSHTMTRMDVASPADWTDRRGHWSPRTRSRGAIRGSAEREEGRQWGLDPLRKELLRWSTG